MTNYAWSGIIHLALIALGDAHRGEEVALKLVKWMAYDQSSRQGIAPNNNMLDYEGPQILK